MKVLVAACALLLACSSRSEEPAPVPEPNEVGAEKPVAADQWPAVGSLVATRTYGVGKVTKATAKSVVVEGSQGQKLQIPRDKVRDLLRPLADEATADRLLTILRGNAEPDDRPWSERHKQYTATIRDGDPLEMAKVLRALYATTSPLSFGEAKLAAQIELLLFDEIARAKGTSIDALEKEFYGEHPKAAPRSKRDPMVGDCWLRFCFRSIETDGPRSSKDVWLAFMRNGNRLGACVPEQQGHEFELEATIDADGKVTITKLHSKAPKAMSECVRKALAEIPIRQPAKGMTRVSLGFAYAQARESREQ
jgi:RNA polymerase-interacting CarD/CdnL/TRCF family regulator